MFKVRVTTTGEPGHPAGPELKPLFGEMRAFDEEMARCGG